MNFGFAVELISRCWFIQFATSSLIAISVFRFEFEYEFLIVSYFQLWRMIQIGSHDFG